MRCSRCGKKFGFLGKGIVVEDEIETSNLCFDCYTVFRNVCDNRKKCNDCSHFAGGNYCNNQSGHSRLTANVRIESCCLSYFFRAEQCNSYQGEEELGKDRFPNSTDSLRNADLITKLERIMDRWRSSVPLFTYDRDNQWRFTFIIREAKVKVDLAETPGYAVCRVDPSGMPPLRTNYPFNPELLRLLREWWEKRIYSSLELYADPNLETKEQKTFAMTTKACLSEYHVTASSLLHCVTEISDGYWQLARAMFNAGLLETLEPDQGPSGNVERIEDVKFGLLTGKMAEQVLPSNFSSLLQKETVPLVFYNLIGDEPGSSMQELMNSNRARFPGVFTEGHMDVYHIASKYLRNLIYQTAKLMGSQRAQTLDFRLETIHQGFPPRPSMWGREVFLAIRYVIKVADLPQLESRELEAWKESMLFSKIARIPAQYNVVDGSVELLLTFPFSVLRKANFVYPQFQIDNPVSSDLYELIKSSTPSCFMKRDNDHMRKLAARAE